MHRKYIVYVLIPALLIQLCGCYSMKELSKDEMAGLKDGGDLIVQKKNSSIYYFEKSNYHISNDTLYGKGYAKYTNATEFKIVNDEIVALTNIETIQQDGLNWVPTTLLIIGCVLLSFIVLSSVFKWNIK